VFFRLLPPLRFHVTVVRVCISYVHMKTLFDDIMIVKNVDGQSQRAETVMNAEQLRMQLLRILRSADSAPFAGNQSGFVFEVSMLHHFCKLYKSIASNQLVAVIRDGAVVKYLSTQNLGGIRAVRQGVRDVNVYPSYVYEQGTVPEDKNT
jgi:hypothetical protein